MICVRLLVLVVSIVYLVMPVLSDSHYKAKSFCNCPLRYALVCGDDGHPYLNPCRAQCNEVKVKCEGACPCKPPPPPKCIAIGHPCRSAQRCCPCPSGAIVKCWNKHCFCPVVNGEPKKPKDPKKKRSDDDDDDDDDGHKGDDDDDDSGKRGGDDDDDGGKRGKKDDD